jgi:hypothetical protein
MQRSLKLLSAVAILAAAGCASVSTPRLFETRPTELQQSTAQRFDPFPENDTGPEVEGGRPREFDKPIAEPSRARWNPFTWGRR